jgi:hypothetical protein
MWSIWLWVFPSRDVQVYLWMLRCRNIVLLRSGLYNNSGYHSGEVVRLKSSDFSEEYVASICRGALLTTCCDMFLRNVGWLLADYIVLYSQNIEKLVYTYTWNYNTTHLYELCGLIEYMTSPPLNCREVQIQTSVKPGTGCNMTSRRNKKCDHTALHIHVLFF